MKELYFFSRAVWRARALLVPVAHVTRDRRAGRFGLRAFESNDLLRHTLVLAIVRFRFLFFALGAFFISQTEERGDRLPHRGTLVLLLEL